MEKRISKLINTQGINCITMNTTCQTQCDLGGDWYTNELTILFMPGNCYPDYTEVQDYLMKYIDGRRLNIEDVVALVYEFLQEYEPKKLKVIDRVRNCKTHFDVTVER